MSFDIGIRSESLIFTCIFALGKRYIFLRKVNTVPSSPIWPSIWNNNCMFTYYIITLSNDFLASSVNMGRTWHTPIWLALFQIFAGADLPLTKPVLEGWIIVRSTVASLSLTIFDIIFT